MMSKRVWIVGALFLSLLGCEAETEDPGSVMIHRLNRAEYNNTVRDLMGTSLTPAEDFPSDDHGYGFDHISDIQATSPLQIELYHRAAVILAEDLLQLPRSIGFQAEELDGQAGSKYRDYGWSLWDEKILGGQFELNEPGNFKVVIRAFGVQQGPELPKITVLINDEILKTIEVPALVDAPAIYEIPVALSAGTVKMGFQLANPFYGDSIQALQKVILDWVKVMGPLDGLTPTSAKEAILDCELSYDVYRECAKSILSKFATHAFRRPVESDELSRLVGLVDSAIAEGDTPEVGLSLAMQAILLSPHFLFRVELDPNPDSTQHHLLSDYELASRLSYFLWSSMPDEELFELAGAGALQDSSVIKEQVSRMLVDSKAKALTHNFAGQWLYSRAVLSAEPEPNMYPEFDDALAQAMKTESDLFFEEFVTSNRPIAKLLTPGFTFLNERLANHYEIEGVTGSEFRKVSTTGTRRGGLLAQGAMHTVTSHQTRTSPVLRGKWVLSQLLCDEPDPPPPGVEALEDQEELTGTLRDRLLQHQNSSICSSCHMMMDPIGFAIEPYNAISQWRTEDEGFPIDARGDLPDGSRFDGPQELAEVLSKRDDLLPCITEHFMIYGLARGPLESDKFWHEKIAAKAEENGAGIQDIINAIATSPVFRMRQGGVYEEGAAQ